IGTAAWRGRAKIPAVAESFKKTTKCRTTGGKHTQQLRPKRCRPFREIDPSERIMTVRRAVVKVSGGRKAVKRVTTILGTGVRIPRPGELPRSRHDRQTCHLTTRRVPRRIRQGTEFGVVQGPSRRSAASGIDKGVRSWELRKKRV